MKTIIVNGQYVTLNRVPLGVELLKQINVVKHGAVAGTFTNAELEYIHGIKRERYENR